MAQTVNNEPQMSGGDMMWLLLLMALMLFMCMSTSSCSTSKYTSSKLVTHDTIQIVTHDTAYKYNQIKCWDTLREYHDTTIIVKEDGSIVGKNITNTIYRNVGKTDTVYVYRSSSDSTYKSKDSNKNTDTKKIVKYSWYNYLLLALVAVAIFVAIAFYKKR